MMCLKNNIQAKITPLSTIRTLRVYSTLSDVQTFCMHRNKTVRDLLQWGRNNFITIINNRKHRSF